MDNTHKIKINHEVDFMSGKILLRKLGLQVGLSSVSLKHIAFVLTTVAELLCLGAKVKGELIINLIGNETKQNGIQVLMRVNNDESYDQIKQLISVECLESLVDCISINHVSPSILEVAITKF